MMDVTLFILPAIVGVGIGILSGLLGIGGGTVMVPVFRLVFDMSPVVSTATSLFAIIPTSISGAVTHVRHKTCIPSLGIAAGLGGALTSPLGVWLAQISEPWMIMVAAALIIGWSAINMISKAIKMKPTKTKPDTSECVDGSGADVAKKTPEADTGTPATFSRRQLLMGAGIGLLAGVASGYVGVGGGFLMVPLMLSLVGIGMRQASGTSLIAVMILAVPGVVEQALLGNIDYMAGIAISIGTIPGALIGAQLVRFVPERVLRFIFGGFLIVAAVLLAINEFGILG
ncbi:hypothetical protein EGYY_28770 [Eggerthella sp. YY7918]|nr:hypothetical protein EGYY_28770 [Eggerthella sp. YY7918]